MPIQYTAVGNASSDINHAMISLVYTATGYACIDFILVSKLLGTLSNDINLGCSIIWKIELSASIGYRIVVYTSSVHTQPLGMLAVKLILGSQPFGTLAVI